MAGRVDADVRPPDTLALAFMQHESFTHIYALAIYINTLWGKRDMSRTACLLQELQAGNDWSQLVDNRGRRGVENDRALELGHASTQRISNPWNARLAFPGCVPFNGKLIVFQLAHIQTRHILVSVKN